MTTQRSVKRLYCSPITRSQHYGRSSHIDSHILFPRVTPYEIYSPDFKPSDIEEKTPQKKEVLPKFLTKKEIYAHADEVATAKSSGCAPIKRALTLIRGLLHARSQLKTSLSDRSVTLFNFHTTDFAEKLVNSNIGSLVLVESEHSYARQAKTFARVQRSQSRNVAAYRTELTTLLGISRKKVPAFPSHLLSAHPDVPQNPFAFVRKDPDDESGNRFATSPILVSALPIISQQKSVLNALFNNLLLHHVGIDQNSLYAYGEVELVTFLSAYTLSHLLASANPCLSFMSHSHRRNSALFFKLFNIELLRVDGFSRHSFSPPISLPKQIPHEKRLKELNMVNGLLYAVSIRPARSIELGSVEVGGATDAEGRGLEAQCLLPFVFWMNLIGKQNASKKTCKVLEELCPESSSSALRVVDGSTPIGELSTLSLEEVFIIVREELKHLQSYEKYKEVTISKKNT